MSSWNGGSDAKDTLHRQPVVLERRLSTHDSFMQSFILFLNDTIILEHHFQLNIDKSTLEHRWKVLGGTIHIVSVREQMLQQEADQ